MKSGLIDIQRPVTVCRASAGTGKTYTLAAYYVGLLLSGEDYKSILAITNINKKLLGDSNSVWDGMIKIFKAKYPNIDTSTFTEPPDIFKI